MPLFQGISVEICARIGVGKNIQSRIQSGGLRTFGHNATYDSCL